MADEKYIALNSPRDFSASRANQFPPLQAVTVWESDSGAEVEHYELGKNGVDCIEWNLREGEMSFVPTIVVFKNGKPFSEHYFRQVRGVYYREDLTPIEES